MAIELPVIGGCVYEPCPVELNLGGLEEGVSNLSRGEGGSLAISPWRVLMLGFLHPEVVWEKTKGL